MHQTVATVHAADIEAAVEAVRSCGDATWCEVRLDALWTEVPDPETAAVQLDALLAAAQVPLLATLRPRRQGGTFDGPEEVRLGLLEAAARAGFAAIDVENDLLAMAPLLHHLAKASRCIVLSNHLPSMPDGETGARHLTAMQDLGARIHKLAFPGEAFPAVLRALELARLHATRHGRPAIASGDADTRALLALVGNHVTYGASVHPAPEQVPLHEIRSVWRHWDLHEDDLAGQERALRPWLAVLGDPVGHSLSPRMHNAGLRAEGRAERFAALQVPAMPGMLRLALAVGPRIGLAGGSVTSPHKEELVRIAEPDAVAGAVGAANCFWYEDGAARCTNTDATTFLQLLAGAGNVLILGAGGAARAAAWAAREASVPATISARDPEKARALAKAFGAKCTNWEQRHVESELVLQCTPADAWRQTPPQRAVELVYGRPTHLAQATRPEGLVDGRAFLLQQGTQAWQHWLGDAPGDAARGAMDGALGL